MNRGDRIRHIYLPYEKGIVVRVIDGTINPYCVMVRVDGRDKGMGLVNFKPTHLEIESREVK